MKTCHRLIYGIGICLAAALLANRVQANGPSEPWFQDGLETAFTLPEQDEIVLWARNSEIALRELLESVQPLPLTRQRDLMAAGIRRIVQESGPTQTELLMRFILNRALKINSILEPGAATARPGTLDQQLRVLTQSARLAIKYYRSDLAYLSGVGIRRVGEDLLRPTAEFAVEYAEQLMQLDASILEASAQYKIAILTLQWLQSDLYRDVNRLAYAPAIERIQRFLDQTPETPTTPDRETVIRIREIILTYQAAMKTLEATVIRSVPQTP
ncbi:MAG: hypothetical protein A2428_07705 [Bdellovibrionales bacterium RIFOXYC1_FULL_54_43]|nr:MAG: hypothetical protein A2428_07705 [Bdellovibrionales bacterium RIFOXYC1_FULL_54_43]OFZ79519.1 MAG: hypothetical protein A2603_09930 [Bdellovibrionales bacterium RIFOXYD1_FULL_55_31]